MSVLKNFKTTPGRPMMGRQALVVFFLLQICNKVHGRKKMKGGPVAPPSGDRWAPPTGATGGLSPPPPSGDRGLLPYISIVPPFPPHLSPKIPPKIQKKREG